MAAWEFHSYGLPLVGTSTLLFQFNVKQQMKFDVRLWDSRDEKILLDTSPNLCNAPFLIALSFSAILRVEVGLLGTSRPPCPSAHSTSNLTFVNSPSNIAIIFSTLQTNGFWPRRTFDGSVLSTDPQLPMGLVYGSCIPACDLHIISRSLSLDARLSSAVHTAPALWHENEPTCRSILCLHEIIRRMIRILDYPTLLDTFILIVRSTQMPKSADVESVLRKVKSSS